MPKTSLAVHVLFCVGLAICTSATCPAACSANEFLISYWWGPPATDQSMALIADAHFNLAVVEEGRHALDLAQKHGLKALINDPRIMAKRVGDAGFAEELSAVTSDYRDHPALWGYFITDEPNASQFDNLAAIHRELLKHDAARVPFINLFPTYASPQQLGTDTYEQHVDAFMRTVKPKVLSYDHYALMQNGIRPDYFENLEIIRRAGLKYNTPFVYVLLSVPHFSYRDPSESDLRWQINTALAYGAQGIVYFTYVSPPETKDFEGWGEAIVTGDGKPTPRYDQVKRINAEVRVLGKVLATLTSTAVYHTEPVPQGAVGLPTTDLVSSIAGGELVIGHFRNDQGRRYILFTNRNPQADADVSITFSTRVKLAEVRPDSGELQTLETANTGAATTWQTRFSAGQGRLIAVD